MRYIKTNNKNFTWYDIASPNREEFTAFASKFKFHPLNIEDCLTTNQRSKVERFENYVFATIRVPIYQRKIKQFAIEEIEIFVANDFVVTVHSGHITSYLSFLENINKHQTARDNFMKSPQFLFYSILNHLIKSYLPILDHISEDIDDIEENIFKGEEKKMVEEISIVLRNIIDLRKVMGPMKEFSDSLLNINHYFFSRELKIFLRDFKAEIDRVTSVLENHYETLKALHETNESLMSHSLADRMKTLTVISVILLPLSLIAGFFGVNMENIESLFGNSSLWILLGFMAIITIVTLIFFKLKKYF
ncbi:MAG: magnesium transporter CorA family protein [bacterium]